MNLCTGGIAFLFIFKAKGSDEKKNILWDMVCAQIKFQTKTECCYLPNFVFTPRFSVKKNATSYRSRLKIFFMDHEGIQVFQAHTN